MADFVKHYRSLNETLKERFGDKVYRIALNGGMTCPNRDGTVGTGGCLFCSEGGSGEFAQKASLPVREQIEHGKKLLEKKQKSGSYIAYFQAFTNTYAPVDYLERIFTEAITHPDIAALSVATRPDCLPEETVALLGRLNRIKPVWVELGLQTSKKESIELIRRGYPNEVFEKAMKDLGREGLERIVHIILGLPGETETDMENTVRYVASFVPEGVKLQLLHVLKNTGLAELYEAGGFRTLTQEEYIRAVLRSLELLPPQTVIHRLTGDSPHGLLIAPKWSEHKWEILNEINRRMEEEQIFQGSRFSPR